MEKEINCVYGSDNTRDTCFIVGNWNTGFWYCVQGSVNVNKTMFDFTDVDFVNVEELDDFDCYTAQEPIETLEELEKFLEEKND